MFTINVRLATPKKGNQGDIVIKKDFDVFDSAGHEIKTGCIVQLVEKRTTAFHKDPKTGEDRLIEDISEFTDNYVNYMDFDYIEMFESDQRGFSGDAFANGAIAKYEKKKAQIPDGKDLEDIPYLTKGSIDITGTILYIPNKEEAIRIGRFRLPPEKNHPANGLLVAESTAIWNRLVALNQASPAKVHNVLITWDYATGKKSVSKVVTNEVSDLRLRGGGRKKRMTRKKRRQT